MLNAMDKPDYAGILNMIWHRQLEFPRVLDYANQIEPASSGGLLAVLYQTWLQRNATGPYTPFASFNLGVTLFGEGDLDGARQAYERAIGCAPQFVQPHFNLGLVLEQLGDTDGAIEQWQWVEQHAAHDNADERPVLIAALNNLGRIRENRKDYADAMACLERSLTLDPDQPDVLHHWVFIREKQCLWPIYDPPTGVSPDLMRKATSALAMLSLSDNPEEQLSAAKTYVQRKIPADLPTLAPRNGYGHDKIRIAYCSSDFCLHPVSMLTVELLELHDREKFEIYGFCWSPEDGSSLRDRVVRAFDHYIRIDNLTEEASAHLIREHEIDILVDLHGQTRGARTRMLAYRPAPIQITYLGLPATTGLPAIDYVIADRFLIPEEYTKYYTERPLYMPDVYQVSDRKRTHASAPTREDCGLPDDGFVFCSFNNSNKYTPEVFATWMNILRRVPASVLWLLADNPWAETNLRREAQVHGIDPTRLIFAKRVTPEAYLARYTVPDLFLDTFPFNAGTTANDALWMGLPLLTLSGRCFASRMAGALLNAAELPELITHDLASYEDRAVALANDQSALMKIRAKLAVAKEHGPLFDTALFTSNLEAHYAHLIEDLQVTDAPPAGINAPPAADPESIACIAGRAERLQADGDLQGAIETYRAWLAGRSSQDDWLAYFNLGVLLKDAGELSAAQQAFRATLQQRPDFVQAKNALEWTSRNQAEAPHSTAQLIAYKPRILLLRDAAIGDVILTLPVIRQIQDDYQGACRIDVVTAFPEVFSNNPWVNRAFTPHEFEHLQAGYDRIINLNLAYERYPGMHIIDAYERVAFGTARHIRNRRPMLFPLAQDATHVDAVLKDIAQRRFMVVHMRRGAWPSRNIPVETWQSVIDKVLAQTDLTVLQVGARTDLILDADHDGRLVNFVDQFTLQQLQLLIARSTLFLGIDSGTLHVAACTDTPIVCLFTSAHHDYRKPNRSLDNNIFIPVTPDIACYGCQARFTPPITGVVCDQGDPMSPPCRERFDADKIFSAIMNVLSQRA